MEYLCYSFLSWLLLSVSGLWLSLVCLPAPLKRYALAFAPSIGYCYIVFASYYLYRANVPGSDSYAVAVLAIPLILLVLGVVGEFKMPLGVKGLLNRDVAIMATCTAAGFGVISIPFLFAKHGAAISLSLGNLDIAELASLSRFLQEFPRDSKVGLLGKTAFFLYASDDLWFGPSAIVAFASSILGSEPYRIQSLVMNVLAAQGAAYVYLLAKESLDYHRPAAAALSALYIVNPVVIYTAWQSFGGQMISMPLLLAALLAHTLALRRAGGAGDCLAFAPLMVILLSGVLLTYHYMILVVAGLLLVYTLLHFLLMGRLLLGLRLSAALLMVVGACFVINPFRLGSLISTLTIVAASHNGWFIPWLSPDILLGANATKALLGSSRWSIRWIWVAVAAIALAVSALYSIRTPRRTGHLSFLVGLFLPVFVLGLYFAVSGMEHGVLGGYRSFKITSTFTAIVLLGLSLWLGTASWRASRARVVCAGIFLSMVTAVCAVNITKFVAFASANVVVLPDEIVELRKIEGMPFVSGINVLDADDFSLLWMNYFAMRKPQVYQRFLYGGRPVGPLDQEFYLSKSPEARGLGGTHDMFFVDTSSAREKHHINRWFTIYRTSPERDVTVSAGDGWLESDPMHQWCGTKEGSCAVWVDSKSGGVRISVEARFVPRRTGESLSVTVNDLSVEVTQTDTALITAPFLLRAGRNVVRFTSSHRPEYRPGGDPRTSLIGWRSFVVRFADAEQLADAQTP